ncbi:GTP-binding sar1 [Tubulinosema ratisbonensis]|uniref:Small COPII coat GTPase SAR1 n=1 Tax=Tubulinosema ratisbonensis TaxID=291195 RepID=A0A437AJ73_9MICR|nr:GTP-binding sar1 [Tubulinosema ratisbonensis]
MAMQGEGIFDKIKNLITYIYENTVSYITKTLWADKVNILFLGIDNAGKTTLLNKLKNDTTGTFIPTNHSNKAEIEIGNMTASIIDLGGHEAARMIWRDYFFSCDGIIFIVDVVDTDRFKIVKEAFQIVKTIDTEKLPPVVVFFNKIDKLNHDSESARRDINLVNTLSEETGIYEQDISSGQPVYTTYVSIAEESPNNLSGEMVSSFQWLQKMINIQKKSNVKSTNL